MRKKENNGNGKGRKPNPGRRLSITSSETDGVLQRRKAKTQAGSLSLPTDARPVWSPAEYNANAQIRCCANNASIVRGVPMRPSHARSPSLPPPRSSRPSAGTTAAMFSLHTDPVPSSAPATSAPVYRCSHADLIAIWHQLASDRPPQRVLVLLPQRSLPRSSQLAPLPANSASSFSLRPTPMATPETTPGHRPVPHPHITYSSMATAL